MVTCIRVHVFRCWVGVVKALLCRREQVPAQRPPTNARLEAHDWIGGVVAKRESNAEFWPNGILVAWGGAGNWCRRCLRSRHELVVEKRLADDARKNVQKCNRLV